MEYYFDDIENRVVITSGENTLRLTQKEFEDITGKKLSGLLFGLHKKP